MHVIDRTVVILTELYTQIVCGPSESALRRLNARAGAELQRCSCPSSGHTKTRPSTRTASRPTMAAPSSVWQSVTAQFDSIAKRDYASLRGHNRSLSDPDGPNPSHSLPSEHYTQPTSSFSLPSIRQLPYFRAVALLLCTFVSVTVLWTVSSPSHPGRPSHARPSRVDSQSTPSTLDNAGGNRTLISYVYHETPDAKANAEFFLRHAMHDASDFVFIVNGKLDTVNWPVERSNVRVVRRNNTCFDLGAHGEYGSTGLACWRWS